MDLGIAGKVALVTGGSRGLGRQAALSLAAEGAKVAICARTQENLDVVLPELTAAGAPAAAALAADVTDNASLEQLHAAVVEQLGPIDILVNNAGASRRGDVLAIGEEEWSDLWALNVLGPIRLSRLVLPGMQERQWGRIVNVSSIWGREHGGGVAYMTTKAALIAFTKSTALSYAKDGILINSVAPGSVVFPTGSWDRFQTQNEPEVVQDFIKNNLPMERFGWPEPVGDLIAFLCSERAGFLTGTTINIDGGQSKSLI